MLGQGTVKFTRDRRGNLHSYWLDREGKAREFYTKGASAWPLWKRAIRMGEIRRCPSYDLISERRDALQERKRMKVFATPHEDRKIIVIVNGFPRAGKDTFVDFAGGLFSYMGWAAYALSSVDGVKDVTEQLGVKCEPKTPEKRALWADMKAALEKYDFTASRMTMNKLRSQMFTSARPKQVGFVFVREPASIAFMKTEAQDCEFITVFVDRTDAEIVTSNAADMDVRSYEYDFIINNNSNLDELKLESERFVHAVIAKKSASQ